MSFLENKSCSIYEIRPLGCRLFPKTDYGVQTQDCEALNRFKKMQAILKKDRVCKENYYFKGKTPGLMDKKELLKSANYSEKQYLACIVKLCKAGMTEEELAFLIVSTERKNNSVRCCL
jgi:Fe-S-cluster containining protein